MARRLRVVWAVPSGSQPPRSGYVREDAVLPRLDARLGRLFDPANLDATVAAPAAVDGGDSAPAEIERCRRTLADCDQRLARYRTALEAGTDPSVVAQWTAEVQAEQARAQHDLRSARGAQTSGEPGRARSADPRRGDLVTFLAGTDAGDWADLYAALGLRLSYQPDERKVVVECRPNGERCARGRVGGET